MKNELLKAVNDAVIRRLATEQAYQRGADYFSHGHVLSSEQHGQEFTARVRGSKEYTVDLNADEGILDYTCDCPAGSEGTFCKHCVAVALHWLTHGSGAKKKARAGKKPTLAEAAKILHAEEKDALVGLFIGWAKDDNQLRERILVYAARRLGTEAAADAARSAFEKAVRVRGYLSYRETKAWARGVDRAIDLIEQLLKDGQAAAVIELSESALGSLSNAADSVDESEGSAIDLFDRLEDIHLRACHEARPDPRKLAECLFAWEMDISAEVFYQAVLNYADILGEQGMRAYRELAEAEWAKIPVRTAKDKPSLFQSSSRIQEVMEMLAELSGDFEQRVTVLSRDLSHPHNYWRLANLYQRAGRHDEAMRTAEEGLRAFPHYADPRLRAFVADTYQQRNASK